MTDFSVSVKVWWGGMTLVSLVNLSLWTASWLRQRRREADLSGALSRYGLWQCWMSGVYVLGCASRSFVIRGDVRRFSMIDHWFSSVLIGRTIATIAEVCFVVQWALLLHLLGTRAESQGARRLSWSLVPIIVIAECCSWFGVVTTNYLGNAVEESLWALTAMLTLVGFALCYKNVSVPYRRFLNVGFTSGVCYILFMITVDIPTYLSRWRADELAGKTYLTLGEGLVDIQRYVVTGRHEDWQYDMVWMSLYFSVAVWISLALTLWPFQENRAERDRTPDHHSGRTGAHLEP